MTTAVRVEDLAKRYYLGDARSNSLRDALMKFVRSPKARTQRRELWALRNVNFELADGETLGIIGNNGAGKSTLLKILSRVTKPTAGRVEIRGRVGSLLEVGTGFHNELSGRENIFLNGAILGMKRAEIEKQFDEIVAFADLEKFLDTPVKFYSSGMYMRLAFAVAAHLEPEVLIVDEVLAVGDIAFQKKCLNKMRDVSRSGRTILFVSHDMQAVSRLCQRVIWLKDGEIAADGETGAVVNAYLHEQSRTGGEKSWPDIDHAPGNEIARLRRVRVVNDSGESISSVDIRRQVGVEMTYDVLEEGRVLNPNYHFYNEQGVCIFIAHDLDEKWRYTPRPAGTYVSTAWVPGNFLAEGTVFVTAVATTYQPFDIHFSERDIVAFNVVDSLDGDSARGDYAGMMPGIVRPILNWETAFVKDASPVTARSLPDPQK